MTAPDSDHADHLQREAELWAVRSARGDLTPAMRADLEAWLEGDRRRRGAYLHARAALIAMERAVVGDRRPGVASNDNAAVFLRRARRAWPVIGALGAAAAACVLFVAPDVIERVRQPHPAAAPGQEVLALADGSRVTLLDGGRISVVMSEDSRTVVLLQGGARFVVASDPNRPFVVQSGLVRAQAVGTIYSVRRLGERGGVVEVAEGGVRVWAEGEDRTAALLHAGDRLTLDPSRVAPPPAKPASRPASTAPVRLSFEDTPISTAVRQFNRANRTQIVIADPAIGEIEIVGRFRQDDPQSFSQAIASLSGGEITNEDGKIVIRMKN